MAAAKRSKSAKSTGDASPEAAAPAPTRRPLVVNVNIAGKWYGPAWGNAADYPADGTDGRPELFGDDA